MRKNKRPDSDEPWLSLVEKGPFLGHWEFLVDKKQFNCSPDFFKSLGYRSAKFKPGQPVTFKWLHAEDKNVLTTHLKKLIHSGRKGSTEFRVADSEGRTRSIKSVGRLIKNDKGKPEKLIGIFQDQARTKQSKQTLQKRREELQHILDSSGDRVTILDSKGNYIYVGRPSSARPGNRPEIHIGENAFSFIHKDDLAHVKSMFDKLATEKRVEITPFRFANGKGHWRWIETVITNLMDDPSVGGMVARSRDVTDKVILQKTDLLERELMEKSIREEPGLEDLLTAYMKGLEGLFSGMKTSLFKVVNGKIKTYLSPSLSGAYLSFFNGEETAILTGSGDTGTYGRDGIIIAAIESDPRWKKNAARTLKQGLRTCWSIPVFNSKGEIVSAFVNYYDTLKQPSEIELEILKRSASLIGLIIENYNKTKAISRSNERYELVNEVTKDAIYEWDVLNDIFYWGENFYRLFNYPKSDKVFRLADWSSLMHPLDREINEIPWQNFMADRKQTQWIKEFRFKCGDNRYAYVEETGRLIRDKKGRPVRMIGVLRDTTATRKFESQKELQYSVSRFFKSDQSLRTILKSILNYLVDFGEFNTGEIWLADSKNRLLNLHSFVSSDDLSESYFKHSSHQTCFAVGEGLPGTVLQKSGPEIWNNLQTNSEFLRRDAAILSGLNAAFGVPIFYKDAPIGVLMFCNREKISEEIIECYKSIGNILGAELKRKQQEEEMQILFESAPEILAIVSPDGYFTKVNRAFCELMGMTREEILSQPFTNFVHADDLLLTSAAFQQSMSGGQKANNFVNRYRTKSGDYKWISWASSDLFGEEGFTFAYGRDVTDIKRLEKLLADATKLARVGAWEVDLNRKTIYWSPMAKDIYEVAPDFTPDFENGLTFFKEGWSQNTVVRLFMEGVQTGRPWDVELPIVTARGNEYWVRTIGEAQFADGVCTKVIGSVQDIDLQKQAEFLLQKLVLERDNILERISDAFFAVDTSWIVTYWNGEAERMLGIKRDEIIGKIFWDFYPDAAGLKLYTEFKRAMSSKETVHFEEYYSKTNMWAEVSVYPSDTGLSVFFRDISLRRLAEEQIRQSNERFDNVAKATNDAIWDWDIVNNTLYWGEGFSKLFGYEVDKVVPSLDSWIERIHPEDVDHVKESVESTINSEDRLNWQQEYRYLKADQTYAFVIDRGIVIRDSAGRAIRMVGAMADITYQKDHEESMRLVNEKLSRHASDLEISNKELEQFAYVASHDLQEPLRMVTSFLTQLDTKYGNSLDERAKTYIGFAVDGAVRMRQIILDLLEFSRLRKFDDPQEEIDLNQLIKDVCILQQKLIEEKQAEIVTSELPVIKTFRSPVSQVFQNLIGNALKYSKADLSPRIEIDVQETATDWIFSIRDNGIGIDNEFHEKIFVIFQRLHNKNEFSGTGMGLAIVKKIVENMKGKIWVDSKVGEGSTFFFTLPK